MDLRSKINLNCFFFEISNQGDSKRSKKVGEQKTISKREKEKVEKMLQSVFCANLSSRKYPGIRESNARWGSKRNTFYHLVKGLSYVEELRRCANRLFNDMFFEKEKYIQMHFEDCYQMLKKIDKYFALGFFNDNKY